VRGRVLGEIDSSRESWRLTLKRAGPPSRLTTTSSKRHASGGGLISIRQSAGPNERNPWYRYGRRRDVGSGATAVREARDPDA